MKIFIASDHAGYELKEEVKNELMKSYEVVDLGTNSVTSVDYPNYAIPLGEQVVKENGKGILICGTGIGMSIACNKVKGIRCAKVDNLEEAKLTRLHNNANVIALSSHKNYDDAIQYIATFLTTPFSMEERHQRRIHEIEEYER